MSFWNDENWTYLYCISKHQHLHIVYYIQPSIIDKFPQYCTTLRLGFGEEGGEGRGGEGLHINEMESWEWSWIEPSPHLWARWEKHPFYIKYYYPENSYNNVNRNIFKTIKMIVWEHLKIPKKFTPFI